jgi:hypothetical protein
MELERRFTPRLDGFFFGCEAPQMDELPVSADARLPTTFTKTNTQRRLRAGSTAAVPHVLGMRTKPQVRPSVVKRIAVDVIDANRGIRNAENDAMHQNRDLTASAFLPEVAVPLRNNPLILAVIAGVPLHMLQKWQVLCINMRHIPL